MSLLVAATWVVIGFFVLRYLGGRYVFHEHRRADIAAATVVLAFIVGAYWPLVNRNSGLSPSPLPAPSSVPIAAAPATAAPTVTVPVAAVSNAAPPEVPRIANVTNYCRSAKAQPQSAALGFFDLLSDERAPNDVPRPASVGSGNLLVARGWAAPGRHLAKAVCLIVDGHVERRAISFYGLRRPDVAAAMGLPALGASGFTILLPPSAVANSSHRLQVAAESSEGSLAFLSGSWNVSPAGVVSAGR